MCTEGNLFHWLLLIIHSFRTRNWHRDITLVSIAMVGLYVGSARFGRISPKLGLTTPPCGWMPSESTSQVPSRSAAQFAIPAVGNLPQLKILRKCFLGCPCPPAPAPASDRFRGVEFPPRPLSSPLHFLLPCSSCGLLRYLFPSHCQNFTLILRWCLIIVWISGLVLSLQRLCLQSIHLLVGHVCCYYLVKVNSKALSKGVPSIYSALDRQNKTRLSYRWTPCSSKFFFQSGLLTPMIIILII